MTLEEAPKLEIEFDIALFMEKNNLAIHLGTTEFYCTTHYFVDKDGNNVTLFIIDDNELIVTNTDDGTTYSYLGESFSMEGYVQPFMVIVYVLVVDTNVLSKVNSGRGYTIVVDDDETLRLVYTRYPITNIYDITSLTLVNDKLIVINGEKEIHSDRFDNTDVLTWIKFVNSLSSNLED